MKSFSQIRNNKGFTLIELMVAMGIAIIIMAMLVGITNVAMGAWQRSRAEVRASRQAKAMLDVMAKDLECLVVRSGNVNEWLFARTEQTMPGTNNDRSTNAAEFIFFSAASDRYRGGAGTAADQGGDVCTVSYKLAYQDPLEGLDNSNSTFVFYRQLVDPRPTFDTILGTTDLREAFMASAGNNRFETRNTASATNTNAKYDFVCENVYQYSITFRVDVTTVSGATTTVRPVRVTLGRKDNKSNTNATNVRLFGNRLESDAVLSGAMSATNAEIRTGRVSGVEVSITVLSDFGLNQLKTRKFADDDAKARFLAEHSYQFSKSVNLPGM